MLSTNETLLLDNVSYIQFNASTTSIIETQDYAPLNNRSDNVEHDEDYISLSIVVPITIIYCIIFLSGLIGNLSTCIVIARNKSMHTATNYYLFSLAISDLLLLLSALPPEIYRNWYPAVYVFGETFCVLQSFAAETSANATVLTITAFTVERYIAICHPFLSHTMSKLSRAVKYVLVIWTLALCLAVPQAINFGVISEVKNNVTSSRCTLTSASLQPAFVISTFLFFVGPMTIITVLYVLIAVKLRNSRMINVSQKRSNSINSTVNGTAAAAGNRGESLTHRGSKSAANQKRVVKMLVAVVVAFFICWAPFHAQRLLAIYFSIIYKETAPPNYAILCYIILNYVSGVLYYMSTTVNPLLYNIMSNKFRDAFKTTLAQLCNREYTSHHRTYSTLSKAYPASCKSLQRSASESISIQIKHVQPPLLTQRSSFQITESTSLQLSAAEDEPPHVYTGVGLKGGGGGMGRVAHLNNRERSITSQTAILGPSMVESRKKNNNKRDKPNRNPVTLNGGFKIGVLAQRLKTSLLKKDNGSTFPANSRTHLRHNSVNSGNTISNSSLQDLDEMEYSSSDLIRYMQEVNDDIGI